MVVLIYAEVGVRELDSKLLLAALAAEKGYWVLVGDVITGATGPFFRKGIFHTKNLSPSKKNFKRHHRIIRRGHSITSLDEEGGLVARDYRSFARERYSSTTIAQTAATFCWGESDYGTLRREFPNQTHRLVMTGSPRADMWDSRFRDYWLATTDLPRQDYALFVSNIGLPAYVGREELVLVREAAMVGAGSLREAQIPFRWARVFPVLKSFVQAIEYLGRSQTDYQIVLRPHPSESAESWKELLRGIPNVRVEFKGPVIAWIQKAFCTVQNGCTSALEAVRASRRVISFVPPDAKHFGRHDLANDLGERISSLPALKDALDRAYGERDTFSGRLNASSRYLVDSKLHQPSGCLSASQIVRTWENTVSPRPISPWRLLAFKAFLAVKRLRDHSIVLFLPSNSARRRMVEEIYRKFPPIDLDEMKSKLSFLGRVLGIRHGFVVQLVGHRTLLVRPR